MTTNSIKARLEKLETKHLGGRRTINVLLRPGETHEQALARHHAQYPTTTPDPTAEVLFITWRGPARGDADRPGTV